MKSHRVLARAFTCLFPILACAGADDVDGNTRDSGRTKAASCGAEPGVLTGSRVGALRIGMTADSVKLLCTVVRDTIEEAEGMPARVLLVAIGADTLRVSVDRDVVRTIWLRSPRFQTGDSLGVGTSLARLLTFPEIFGGYGEGPSLFVYPNREVCGLSFQLDDSTSRAYRGRGPVTKQGLAPFAQSARVVGVIVIGTGDCATRVQ